MTGEQFRAAQFFASLACRAACVFLTHLRHRMNTETSRKAVSESCLRCSTEGSNTVVMLDRRGSAVQGVGSFAQLGLHRQASRAPDERGQEVALLFFRGVAAMNEKHFCANCELVVTLDVHGRCDRCQSMSVTSTERVHTWNRTQSEVEELERMYAKSS